jgi:hypothetical protein
MFAYLIIAFEISFLYTVFWYIFLREPKPFRVVGDPWGRYDSGNNQPASQFNQSPTNQNHRPEWMTYKESLYNEYCPSRAPFRNSVAELPKMTRNPAIKYGWEAEDDVEPTTMPRILVGFRETFEELRLRI